MYTGDEISDYNKIRSKIRPCRVLESIYVVNEEYDLSKYHQEKMYSRMDFKIIFEHHFYKEMTFMKCYSRNVLVILGRMI